MNVKFNKLEKSIKKFQDGGQAPVQEPTQEPAPAETPEQGGEDPLMQIAQAAMQALQAQDCQMAMQVCQAMVELVQQAQGQAEQGAPVFGKGGVLLRRIKQ